MIEIIVTYKQVPRAVSRLEVPYPNRFFYVIVKSPQGVVGFIKGELDCRAWRCHRCQFALKFGTERFFDPYTDCI